MDKIKVLIIEDEQLLAEILADTIKKNPRFHITGITDRIESAKNYIRHYQPQLILLDNFLPDGKGIQLMKSIPELPFPVRTIFITADNHVDTISEAIQFGAFDYLIKPVFFERLQNTLNRFLAWHDSLTALTDNVNQSVVDGLLSMQVRSTDSSANMQQREIDESTFQRVLAFFNTESVQTAESIATQLGSSKTTARRYLEQGVRDRILEATTRFGKPGRPERIYRKIF